MRIQSSKDSSHKAKVFADPIPNAEDLTHFLMSGTCEVYSLGFEILAALGRRFLNQMMQHPAK